MGNIFSYVLAALLYIFLQLFLLNHLDIVGLPTPYLYLLFLFLLPIDIPKPFLYLIAFGLGMIIDVFSDNAITGLHAFSALLAIGLRPRVLQVLGASGARGMDEFTFENQGMLWYIGYLLPLVFVHHLAYYFLESMTLGHFFSTLLDAIQGTLFTTALCYLVCVVFYRR